MRLWLVVLLAFLGLGLVVYAPSLTGPWQFDDKRVVLDPKIRERETVGGFLAASLLPGGVDSLVGEMNRGPLGTRSLVHATFLAQWQLHGETTWPYHVFNVGVHAVTAWLVFILIGQILASNWLSVFGGLVFLLHPVQSQAVAYISQRFESMAAMFYLAAVVLYLKARKLEIRNSKLEIASYAGAWLAGVAAASSKEIAITLPIILIVLEILVIRKRWSVRQSLILVMFWLIPVKIVAQVIFSTDWGGQAPTVGDIGRQLAVVERQDPAMTRWTYLLTQFNVVRTYWRLLVVPVRQSLDYDYPLQVGWDAKTLASLGLHLAIWGIGIWMWRKKQPGVTLGIAWFYLVLLPTSSVIPIRDLIYEHRVYLALAGGVILLTQLIFNFQFTIFNKFTIFKKYIPIFGIGLLTIYAGLTMARNTVWASEVKLWEDAWKKGPNKDRTNKNYGFVLTDAGRLKEGIVRLERAVELNPEDQDYRITLGAAYLQAKDWDKAKAQFEKAVELRPAKADGWNNLGVAEFQLKRYEESKIAFETALKKDPEFYMAWLGLGGVEIVLKDFAAAETALKKAMEIEPNGQEAQRNFAILQRLRLGK